MARRVADEHIVTFAERPRELLNTQLRSMGSDDEGMGNRYALAERIGNVRGFTRDAAIKMMRRVEDEDTNVVNTLWAEAIALVCGDSLLEFAGWPHLPTNVPAAGVMAQAFLDDFPAEQDAHRKLAWSVLRFADGFMHGAFDTPLPSRSDDRSRPPKPRTRLSPEEARRRKNEQRRRRKAPLVA